jgi:hypothetical protein
MVPLWLLDAPEFARLDFAYIGYSGRLAGLSSLGDYLASIIRRALQGELPFPQKYQRVVMVTHSLGGVGVRAALITLARTEPKLFSQVAECLVLAPPLFGFHLSRIERLRIVAEVGSILSPVVLDVVNGSPHLEMIRLQYDDLIRNTQGPKPWSLLRWALYDRVVTDRPADYIPPPPDTQDSWPYSHAMIAKPDNLQHHFLVALRDIAARA